MGEDQVTVLINLTFREMPTPATIAAVLASAKLDPTFEDSDLVVRGSCYHPLTPPRQSRRHRTDQLMPATQLPSTGTPPATAHTGRPVDIEIVPRAHAILSASSAERWLTCTPSARIEEHMEDENSSYASEGTAAHAFAEIALRHWLGEISDDEYAAAEKATRFLYAEHVAEWGDYENDAIDSYVQFVKDRVALYRSQGATDIEVTIEARVDYSLYAPSGFGTSDVLIVSGNLGLIEAIDLKFGQGVAVYAEGNPQLRIYTLGGFLGIRNADTRRKIQRFRSVVHQPRLDNVSEAEITRAEMIDWAENTVKPAAEKAWKGEGELNPTDKGCRFCKAKTRCRARVAANVILAQKEFATHMTAPDENGLKHFDPAEYLLEPAEIAHVLPQLAQFKAWISEAEAWALKEARDNGLHIPGYKLVRGRSVRGWKADESEIVDTIITAAFDAGKPVDREDLYTPPKPPVVLSVAQAEKKVGAKLFSTVSEKLVDKPLGAPTLVPSADSRDAIDKAAEARADFGL